MAKWIDEDLEWKIILGTINYKLLRAIKIFLSCNVTLALCFTDLQPQQNIIYMQSVLNRSREMWKIIYDDKSS